MTHISPFGAQIWIHVPICTSGLSLSSTMLAVDVPSARRLSCMLCGLRIPAGVIVCPLSSCGIFIYSHLPKVQIFQLSALPLVTLTVLLPQFSKMSSAPVLLSSTLRNVVPFRIRSRWMSLSS